MAGIRLMDRSMMYGSACDAISEPGTTPTSRRMSEQQDVSRTVPAAPISSDISTASPTCLLRPGLSEDAAALAISGVMRVGRKLRIQKAELYT
eukprot:scaffold245272_cov47-Prasinocladus_malaysianus.AAC.2